MLFIIKIERYGPQHQAGSDSLLTGLTFFKLKEVNFSKLIIIYLQLS